MLCHSLDIIHNLENGCRLCTKAVILNDFQVLLLKFKAKLHQMTTIFEILYPWTSVEGKMFLDLSFPLRWYVPQNIPKILLQMVKEAQLLAIALVNRK